MCVVQDQDGVYMHNFCPCTCPLGWIKEGCDHLRNYPESAWGITQGTPQREETP